MNSPNQEKNLVFAAEMTGLAGLCLLAFGLFFKVAQANQGLALMTLALLPLLAGRARHLLREPLFLLGILFLFYLSLRTAYAWGEFPGLQKEILDASRRWAMTGFLSVFIVAYWCSRHTGLAPRLLLLALAGLVVRILTRFDWHEAGTILHAFLRGDQRASFGFSANNLGVWCAIAAVGLMLYARPFCGPSRLKIWFLVRASLWLSALFITIGCLFFSQTRAAWIAFIAVLPAALLYRTVTHLRRKRQGIRTLLAVSFTLILLLTLLAGQEVLQKRLLYEREVLLQVMSGEIMEVMPDTSFGQRIGMYWLFFEKFKERPISGWGPGLAKELISQAKMEALVQNAYIHFHNVIFDILIQLGMVGGVFFVAMVWLIVSSLWHGYRQGEVSPDLFIFLAAGFAIFMISGLASEPMLSSAGPYFLALAGGLAYASRLRERDRDGTSLRGCPATRDVKGSF